MQQSNPYALQFILDASFADIDGPSDADAPRQLCLPYSQYPRWGPNANANAIANGAPSHTVPIAIGAYAMPPPISPASYTMTLAEYLRRENSHSIPKK